MDVWRRGEDDRREAQDARCGHRHGYRPGTFVFPAVIACRSGINTRANDTQRFTPVVDRFASVVDSLHSKTDANGAPTTNGTGEGEGAYQYQRAYRLSLDLKQTLFALSGAQIRQIQEHNGLVYVPPPLPFPCSFSH